MQKSYRVFTAIEFAVVASVIASFSVLAVAGLFFGFQIGHWSEWQRVIAGMIVTMAALIGATIGASAALRSYR